MYEDTAGAIKDHYGDYQLVAAYWFQLKAKTQVGGEFLLEFAVVIEQLAYRAFVGLPENEEDTAYAFLDGVNGQEMKHHLLMDGKRSVKEVLRTFLSMP